MKLQMYWKPHILTLLILLSLAVVAFAAYSTANYSEQGGAKWVIGGGGKSGELLIDTNGSLKFAGGLEIKTAAVELTAAEIKALAASPKTIIAAPGANKVIHFFGAKLILDNGATNYDDAAADGNMVFRYTNGSGVIVSAAIEGDGFIDCTADTMTHAIPITDAIVAASAASNQALVLDNDGAEYTTGDGTMTVIVHYGIFSDGL